MIAKMDCTKKTDFAKNKLFGLCIIFWSYCNCTWYVTLKYGLPGNPSSVEVCKSAFETNPSQSWVANQLEFFHGPESAETHEAAKINLT